MNSVLDEIMKATNADSEGSDAVSTNQTPKPGVDVGIGRRLIYVENISITTGLVSANTTSMLLKPLQSGKMKPNQLITHGLQFPRLRELMISLVMPRRSTRLRCTLRLKICKTVVKILDSIIN
ncbi:hypothetical protein V1508DRAFT_99289 [Lipomyces doorenjongii]|uniref:uncharacterized protein n=1 Tax=Lipomyces doorenjongii TaxID=383834 RepID=UPI0034CFB7E0